MDKDITLLTCNFNNEVLTASMLKSFFKNYGLIDNVVILDNSTETKIKFLDKFHTVVDNTNFRITPNFNQVSKNHCCSIDYAFKNIIKTRYVLLCDNDVIFNKNIKNLIEMRYDYDCIGEIGYDTVPPDRIFPYLMLVDLDKVKSMGINYFDETRIIVKQKYTNEPVASKYGNVYDTGYSFYEDLKMKNFNIKNINICDYCTHLKAGSLKTNDEILNFINSMTTV